MHRVSDGELLRLLGYEIADETNTGLFRLIAGHPYANLEIDSRTFNVGESIDIEAIIEQVQQDPSLANYPELGLYDQTLPPGVEDRIDQYLDGYHEVFETEIEPELQAFIDEQRDVPLSSLNTPQHIERVEEILEHLRTVSCTQFVIAARLGFLSTDRLRAHLERLFPEQSDSMLDSLLRGLSGSKISEQQQALYDVSRGNQTEQEYMHRYGHSAANELEISLARVHEDDARYLEQSPERDPRETFERQQAIRQQAEEELMSRLAQEDEIYQAEVSRDLAGAQTYLPLRETIKYYFTAEYDLVRNSMLMMARQTGLRSEAVFYLEPDELSLLLDNRDQADALISQRMEARDHAIKLAHAGRVASVIFESDLEAIGRRISVENGDEFEVTIISQGTGMGQACLIDPLNFDAGEYLDEDNGSFILVAPQATLGMDPVIAASRGLVVEKGSVLSHAACRAREDGIPAAVMPGATRILEDGERIIIDGEQGKVIIPDEEEDEE